MATTAAQLLLALKKPEDLYPGNEAAAKQHYRQLSRQWHPDLASGNAEVFAHISKLYRQAVERIKLGTWEGASILTIEPHDGDTRRIHVRAASPFALGHSYVGDDYVAWTVNANADYGDMLKRFVAAPSRFKFADPTMKAEFSRYLPAYVVPNRLKDGRYLLEIQKTPDLLRLRDIVTHVGPLDPKHIAWIVSSLMNLACYLTYAGLTHNDISPDTYFVSPKYHSGALLGGWFYSVPVGERLREVPRRTFDLMPFSIKRTKVAMPSLDLALIRATALDCMHGSAPPAMQKWLEGVSVGSARDQYEQWQRVLEQSFGQRKFTELRLTADMVYGALSVTS